MKSYKIKKMRIGIIKYIFMIALVSFTAMPLVYLVCTAFKPLDELFVFPPRFFVRHPTLANFSDLLTVMDNSSVPFSRYFFNSALVSLLSVILTILVCTIGAYSLTKLCLPYKKLIFSVIVAALMFSAPVAQISNFIIINKLKMVNTYWALIVPKIASAYYFFLIRQNMLEIPDALLEAARIDGCGPIRSFFNIVLPLSRPVMATVAVFAFVANWNDYYSPLIYINDETLKTLPLALQALQGGVGQVVRSGAFAASALLTTAPVIIVFVIMQSKVVKTMAHTGIK